METFARSGPGTTFDETSRLYIGDRLEIYEETEDGWCAVRPPLGSFSWVAAAHVELAPNGVGTVLTDGLASRIGSDLHQRCRHVAVKLAQGETVRVLDRLETPENPTSPLWYKIAPPCGEFRWVPRSAILFEDVKTPRTEAVPQTGSVSRAATSREEAALTARRLPNPELGAYVEHSVVQVTHETPVPAAVPSNEQTPQLLTPEEVFEKTYQELRQEARYVMARPTEDWVFEMLVDRCDSLYKIAPGDAEREKVLKLSEIIRKTKSIRQEIGATRQRKGLVAPRTNMIRTVANNPSATEETSLGSVGAAARPLSSLNTPAPSSAYQGNYAETPNPGPASTLPSARDGSTSSPLPVSVSPTPGVSHNASVPSNTPAQSDRARQQHSWTPHTVIPSDPAQRTASSNSINSVQAVTSGTPAGYPDTSALPLPINTDTSRANVPATSERAAIHEAVADNATPERQTVSNEITGRLGRFNPLPPGYPPYALADEQGQVLCLLSPEPGIDMADLVGKWVGIDGERSFYVEQGESEKRHILVRQVRVFGD